MKNIFTLIAILGCLIFSKPLFSQGCQVSINHNANGLAVDFEAIVTNMAGGEMYNWNFGDGGTSTAANPSYTYSATGNYTVYLTAVDSLSCSAMDSLLVSVTAGGGSGYSISVYIQNFDQGFLTLYKLDTMVYFNYADTFITVNEFIFNNVPAGTYLIKASLSPQSAMYGDYIPTYYTGASSWQNAAVVNLNSNMSGTIAMIPNPSTNTTYNTGNDTVNGGILQDTTGFGKAAGNKPVRNTTVNMFDNQGGYLGSELTNLDGQFAFSNLIAGDYQMNIDYPGYSMSNISLTVDGDPSTSNTFNFDLNQNGTVVILGLSNNKILAGNISVYPNPASGTLVINSLPFSASPVQIKIQSLTGLELFNQSYSISSEEIKLDTSKYPSGLYFISVQTEDYNVVKKIVIEH